ncbi:MAG: 4-hydroxy-tetrahydrodipicolinate reductase [Planctomycetota bacterium]
MSHSIQVAVHGAGGRMGQRVVALAVQDPNIEVVAAIEHDNHPALGQDAGLHAGVASLGVSLATDWPHSASAVIDFSLPAAVDACVTASVAAKLPLVVATTGLDESQVDSLQSASRVIPIVWAPSMSTAVNVTMKLAQQAAAKLQSVAGGVDIEIIERHHRFKADAPSGTALRFGELIAESLDANVGHVHGRDGETGARPRNEIGYHAVRVGDNPGEHTIVFGMMGETIEMKVAASNRDCYAAGALSAAKWLSGKSPGLYNMFDVLGMS